MNEDQHRYMVMAWNKYARALAKLEIRKRAVELAVAALGPHESEWPAHEVGARIDEVADRLYAYMTKDKPEFAPQPQGA